ncbi:TniQ family protein [Marinomonas sp.]|uniref:TniQ family protein n=1 Tax=Marinomonas sp. TaxID=1904862 RepID=UPI003A939F47
MVKTNSWHKGTNRVISKWPVSVDIEPDEILSSWLIRIAAAHGCDPIALTNYIWGNWRCWTLDIDRGLPVQQLETLSTLSGTPPESISNTSLGQAINIFTDSNQSTHVYCPFIIPLGSRNRKHHMGFQFCPQCLKSDLNPYYRIQWRIALVTSCSTHHCLLVDKCPICYALVEPHLINTQEHCIYSCSYCGYDLRKTPTTRTNSELITIQEEAMKTINEGKNSWSHFIISPKSWFSLLRYFISLIRKARKYPSSNLAKYLKHLDIDIYLISPPKTQLAFEQLPINERIQFITAAAPMMKLDADIFKQSLLTFSLTQKSFFINKKPPPFPINTLIQSIPQPKRKKRKASLNSKKKKSSSTVQHIWERLKRQHYLKDH